MVTIVRALNYVLQLFRVEVFISLYLTQNMFYVKVIWGQTY